MQLKESISKTKFFFHKSIRNFKSIFLVRYEKLPKAASCNPFLCVGGSIKKRQMDKYYAEFCNEWECDLEKALNNKKKKTVTEESVRGEKDGCDESSVKHRIMSPLKKKEVGLKEEKMKKSSHPRKGEQCSKKQSDEGYVLAKKMKELEMMDVGDVEHVLDVEEALHYYSRLKSPVYLDMVDKFFTDMYKDFSVPQASATINNSKRRLSSIRF
ncbi:transcription repressor OFP17 [Euphorbia lathyris]|uniref:transcription repressor OFP17 n=1 Tax=Euphorbia lathyris TaxID=212925 RepID=UPI00331449BE